MDFSNMISNRLLNTLRKTKCCRSK